MMNTMLGPGRLFADYGLCYPGQIYLSELQFSGLSYLPALISLNLHYCIDEYEVICEL